MARYRGRKGIPIMSILTACTFDLKFTYVLPGWEGFASDSRVLENALSREDKLQVPQGNTKTSLYKLFHYAIACNLKKFYAKFMVF